MAGCLCSHSLSCVVTFSSKEVKLRSFQLSCCTLSEIMKLRITFKSLPTHTQHRRSHAGGPGVVGIHSSRGEVLASRSSLSLQLRNGNALNSNSTKCKAHGKAPGVTIVDSSSSVKKVNNGAAHVVASRKNGAMSGKKTAIVWFKHDLRTDDHPGLAFAAQYDHVIPLFIFDSSFYAGNFSCIKSSRCRNLRSVNTEHKDAKNMLTVSDTIRMSSRVDLARKLRRCFPRRIAF